MSDPSKRVERHEWSVEDDNCDEVPCAVFVTPNGLTDWDGYADIETMANEILNLARQRRECDERINELERGLALQIEARAENERLRKVAELADGLAGEFELAVASRDRTGGMQVTPTGDFVSCAQLPSAVSRMRWWAREIRIALAELDKETT